MEIYLVGGAVRDEQLGLAVKERDWCVVGATPDDLLSKGFRRVGKDFPVFLHPETNEEYALARTERKTAAGYHGFEFHTSPDVTLDDDLSRRDLTIKAMARDGDGNLIDPFDGISDLEHRLLRHVSDAFCAQFWRARTLHSSRDAEKPESPCLPGENPRTGDRPASHPQRTSPAL